MARGRAQSTSSLTLHDFFGRPPRLAAGAEEARTKKATRRSSVHQSRATASTDTGSPARAGAAAGVLHGLPNEVISLVWAFSGPRRCCAIRQASAVVAKLCPCDHVALKRALCQWGVSVVDMAALRHTGDSQANEPDVGPSTASKLGRWGDFTCVTDGAGQGFVRGPALMRCTQRWRMRFHASNLRCSPACKVLGSDISLHEALRCHAAHTMAGEVAAALGAADGATASASNSATSIHFSGSIWDAMEERPAKRRRVSEVSGDFAGAAAEVEGSSSGFFEIRRWDALMDARIPWRLRAAALVYHHHNARGCVHTGVRRAAADFIRTRTGHDERLRAALLDPVDF